VGPRHTLRCLPVQGEGDVDVFALPEARVKQPATLWVLPGIVRLCRGGILRRPGAHEGVAALLGPALKGRLGYVVLRGKEWILRIDERDGGHHGDKKLGTAPRVQ